MTETVKHDPRGLVMHDIAHLRQVFKRSTYGPTNTQAEIMFKEGQQSVVDYIERQLIAKR